MARKRKRHSSEKSSADGRQKRLKTTVNSSLQSKEVQHSYPVLPLYYPHVSSLRDYLLHKLPSSSRSSRRKIKALDTPSLPGADQQHANPLAALLDSVVVGYVDSQDQSIEDARRKELSQFSQTQLNHTAASPGSVPAFSQSEVCQHLACHPFTKSISRNGSFLVLDVSLISFI